MKKYSISKLNEQSLFAIVYENGKEICTCNGQKSQSNALKIKEALELMENPLVIIHDPNNIK